MLRNLAPSVRRTLLAGALTLSAAAAPAAASGDGWYADFDVAAEVAKKENKDLLVDFTGSDWCGWCIKLDNEVFSEEVWQKGVEKEYVLVALDFPNADELKAQVPNPERNRELQDKYGVRGFPTILMMTPDGEVYGQTGYKSGGPEKYLEHMAELRENRALMFEAMELAEKFDGVEGDARWTTAAAMMELSAKFDATQPFARHLEAGMRWAFEEDADNARGVRLGAAAFLLARGDDASDYYQVVLDLDPKNEGGFLERAVATRF
ncbi:MAG: thioredoxin family protein, partial [Planctomycetota bacterium]